MKLENSWHHVFGVTSAELLHAAEETERRYGDLLHKDYPFPSDRPRMSKEKRAAQFMPFAALTGYGEAIEETTEKVASLFAENREKDVDF